VILLSKRKKVEILIDDEDYPKVDGKTIKVNGSSNRYNYGRYAYADNDAIHRLLMGVTDPEQIVDHRNGNTLDNRKQNLRVTDKVGNGQNRKKTAGFRGSDCTSRYKGVSWKKSNKKWQAFICVDRKNRALGIFSSEEEAAQAYNAAAEKYFGAYARLNVFI
jgi:hypothetical protein